MYRRRPLRIYLQGPDDPEPGVNEMPSRLQRYPERYEWKKMVPGLLIPTQFIEPILDELNINRKRRWELYRKEN